MDVDAVKRSLQAPPAPAADLPARFFSALILNGLRIDAIDPGRILCSMTVPPRLTNAHGYLHGGAIATLVDVISSAVFYTAGFPTSGVSLELSTSSVDAAFVDEELEIEATMLQAAKAVGVITVEIRKKNGKAIAQARHTMYLAVSSKL